MKVACAPVPIAAVPITTFAADPLPLPKSVVNWHLGDNLTLLQQLGAVGWGGWPWGQWGSCGTTT